MRSPNSDANDTYAPWYDSFAQWLDGLGLWDMNANRYRRPRSHANLIGPPSTSGGSAYLGPPFAGGGSAYLGPPSNSGGSSTGTVPKAPRRQKTDDQVYKY